MMSQIVMSICTAFSSHTPVEITTQGCSDVDAFAATRLAAGVGFLVVAAASDLRSRRVRDPLWISLGTAGLMILAAQIAFQGLAWPAWLLLVSAAIFFYAVFFGEPLFGEDGYHVRAIRIVLFLAAGALLLISVVSLPRGTGYEVLPQLASMPILVLVYQGFYRLRLLHGGADAKGLIALTLLIPAYPDALPFPVLQADARVDALLRVVFPFSLVIWVDAAVLSLAVPVALLIYNVARGDLALPQALLRNRAQRNPFPSHAWLMEKITARGEHVLVLFPMRGPDHTGEISLHRVPRVVCASVTPQTPFMVPLLLGFMLAFFAGNLLVAVLGLAR